MTSSLNVKELKSLCEKHKLKKTSSKAELEARLEAEGVQLRSFMLSSLFKFVHAVLILELIFSTQKAEIQRHGAREASEESHRGPRLLTLARRRREPPRNAW
jgi:hypothetical protein